MLSRLAGTILLLGIISVSFGQKLSIEDAVSGKSGTLYPDRPDRLMWVEGSDYYSIFESDTLLCVKDKKGKSKKSLSLSDLNKAMQADELSSFPTPNWTGPDEFWFKNGNAIYGYNFKENSVSLLAKSAGSMSNADFNPKAAMVAYTKDNNLLVGSANEVKHITQNDDPNVVSGQAIHRFEFGISKGTFWSPDGKKLAFYQKDETDVTDYPLVDYNSTPAKLNAIKYPMAGQGSENATVGIYDIESAKLTYLEPRKELGKYHYYTNVAWSPDGSVIYVAELNRDQNEMHLNTYDAASGFFLKTLFIEKDEKYVEPEHPPIFIGNDGSQFLWFSERDGYNHLYLYSSDGTLIRQLSSGSFPVTSYLGADKAGKNVFVEARGSSPLNSDIYKLSLTGNLTRLTNAEGVHHGRLNSSASMIIDSYSNPDTPAVTQILSSSGKKLAEISRAEDPLKDYSIGKTEIVEVKAEDGTTLYGRLIYPVDFDESKKYPVITYVYNGPHVQLVDNSWMNRASLWMHSMAGEGYIVWTLDGRGSLNRGRDFEQAVFRNLGSLEIEDQEDGIDYLKTLPYVDADRMAIHGWSFGGFMTTSLMLRKPDMFKVGVAGGPVIDWRLYEVMYTERYMDTPESNPDGFKTADLKNYVTNLKGELLMIHGTVDDVVVMQHNMSFLKKCVDEGVQVDFFVYPGHPHNVRGKDRVHLMKKVLGYIMDRL